MKLVLLRSHHNMTVYRAYESKVPLIRNNGTAKISILQLPYHQRKSLSYQLPRRLVGCRASLSIMEGNNHCTCCVVKASFVTCVQSPYSQSCAGLYGCNVYC